MDIVKKVALKSSVSAEDGFEQRKKGRTKKKT